MILRHIHVSKYANSKTADHATLRQQPHAFRCRARPVPHNYARPTWLGPPHRFSGRDASDPCTPCQQIVPPPPSRSILSLQQGCGGRTRPPALTTLSSAVLAPQLTVPSGSRADCCWGVARVEQKRLNDCAAPLVVRPSRPPVHATLAPVHHDQTLTHKWRRTTERIRHEAALR